MIKHSTDLLERMRLIDVEFEWAGDSSVGEPIGVFGIKRKGVNIRIVVSNAEGWDHVSVSTPTRCPTWEEMCWVKDQFFDPEEAVMQLHPPKSQWVNNHPFCLHLWRPHEGAIILPPAIMVGIRDIGTIKSEKQAREIHQKISNK